MKQQLLSIPLELIDPDPTQPRHYFNEAELAGLAASIKENGVLQPIEVEQLENGRYLIHHGERRWRASQLAGLADILAVVALHLPDDARLLRGIVENLQREDLNPIEEARAFARLMTMGMARTEIARQVGRSLNYINGRLVWLKLCWLSATGTPCSNWRNAARVAR